MIDRKTASFLVLTVIMALIIVPSLCSAAAQPLDKPAKITVKVDVGTPKLFWSYPYITSDGNVRNPAAVQVVWSTTNGLKTDRGDVVLAGKNRGQLQITTEHNAFVDIEIQVVDAKRHVVGKANMQVRNTGQDLAFVVLPPESTAPTIEAL